MRRLTSYMGILLLSLILSGSGSVLVAAFCSHAQKCPPAVKRRRYRRLWPRSRSQSFRL